MWNEIVTSKGTLRWRQPNISEGLVFLSAIQSHKSVEGILSMKAEFIKKLGPMVDYAAIGYESYEEFLNDRQNNFQAMLNIADEVYLEIVRALGKKHSSPMQSTPQKRASKKKI